jgi:hypothetical protein
MDKIENIYETPQYQLDRYGKSYIFTNKNIGSTIFLQGEDAISFESDLAKELNRNPVLDHEIILGRLWDAHAPSFDEEV